MNKKSFSPLVVPMALLLVGCALLNACGVVKTAANGDNEPIGVMITGVHHLGPDFNIGGFSVGESSGGNVSRNGGGASFVCCVELPRKWRPGMNVKVQWSVNDWSKAIRSEVAAGNYKSVTFEEFHADTAIEKYDEVGGLYVHFFSDGKVRVVSSGYHVLNAKHPIKQNDPSAALLAVRGTRITKDAK